MDNDRHRIIVEEIKSWRENQLLPKTYCDFLLNLYTYGEGEGVKEKKRIPTFKKTLMITDLIFLLLLLPLSFLVIFTLEGQLVLQVALICAFLLIIALHGLYFSRQKALSVYAEVSLVLFLLIAFIGSTSLFAEAFGMSLWLNLLIVLHAIIWIAVGWLKRRYYLIAAGFIGILVLGAIIVI